MNNINAEIEKALAEATVIRIEVKNLLHRLEAFAAQYRNNEKQSTLTPLRGSGRRVLFRQEKRHPAAAAK